jgi:excisionase family DNA binding protein
MSVTAGMVPVRGGVGRCEGGREEVTAVSMDTKVPRLLDAKEVAPWLGVHENQVYLWAQQGVLPAIRVGRKWRFAEDEILAWIKAGGTKKRPEEK